MYGKSPKMKDDQKAKKVMPVTVMVAIGKPKPMPKRGQRTATNKAKK